MYESLIKKYWQATLAQDANKMVQMLSKTCLITWPNTNECFTKEHYIKANCLYPGTWKGTVQEINPYLDGYLSITNVLSQDEVTSLHAITFFKINNGLITSIKEYWSEDGAPPTWRQSLDLSTPLKKRTQD